MISCDWLLFEFQTSRLSWMAIRVIFHVFLQIKAEEPFSVSSKPLLSLCFPINHAIPLTICRYIRTFCSRKAESRSVLIFCKKSMTFPSWGHEHRTSTKETHDSTSISPWRSITLTQWWAFRLVICRGEVRISARTLALVTENSTHLSLLSRKR
jgi:ABC-type iron transport system FetAB permease component